MRPGARIAAAIELLETIHAAWGAGKRAPADAMLSDYYKDRRYMGSKDRGFVSELVYFILRHGGTLEWWLEQSKTRSTPRLIVIAALVLGFDHTLDEMDELFTGKFFSPKLLDEKEKNLVVQLESEALFHPNMPDWARYNVSDWLEKKLKIEFIGNFAEQMEALNQEAPLDLRVNTLKCADRSDLIMALDRVGYYGIPTPHSPIGVRLKKRLPVFTLDIFKDGWFEMMDEGSQMVAELVDAQPGQKVIDFCAGAGGKTLAVSAKMQNKGRVLAWDVNETRLNQIKKRLARAGADNVITHVLASENDPFLKRHLDTADWVLLDVPCSGSGTWRRNPDLKWRFNFKDLEEVKTIQRNILASASRLVKSGGKLVYSTCSLFQDENQDQIRAFLVEHPHFGVEPLPEMWNKHTLWHEGVGQCLRLTPQKDGTDGFFAAVLKRQ